MCIRDSCESCQGDGVLRVEMHFLPDVFVECEACGGKRYGRETLEVLYRGMSIADALDLTVDEALQQFDAVPRIRERLTASRGWASATSRSGSRRPPSPAARPSA